MIDIYRFVEECKAAGMSAYEAQGEYQMAVELERQKIVEEYENDPVVWDGWAQQDMIDAHRRER